MADDMPTEAEDQTAYEIMIAAWEAIEAAHKEVIATSPDSCPRVFGFRGLIFVGSLFKRHDTLGFPLAMSLMECHQQGVHPLLDEFISDAVKAGWKREKALKVVASAWNEIRMMGADITRYPHLEAELTLAGYLKPIRI